MRSLATSTSKTTASSVRKRPPSPSAPSPSAPSMSTVSCSSTTTQAPATSTRSTCQRIARQRGDRFSQEGGVCVPTANDIAIRADALDVGRDRAGERVPVAGGEGVEVPVHRCGRSDTAFEDHPFVVAQRDVARSLRYPPRSSCRRSSGRRSSACPGRGAAASSVSWVSRNTRHSASSNDLHLRITPEVLLAHDRLHPFDGVRRRSRRRRGSRRGRCACCSWRCLRHFR